MCLVSALYDIKEFCVLGCAVISQYLFYYLTPLYAHSTSVLSSGVRCNV